MEDRPKYAMYLRKSRADLELEAMGEGETLARHRAELFELATRHDILPDQIDVYQEIVSGDSLQDRPEAQRLLAAIYLKKYKGVFVKEIERLARGNTRDQGEVANAFSYSSTLIITPIKVYNPDDESDENYFEFGLFMSRQEYKTIRRRLVAGKDRSAAEGNFVSNVRPYGFEIVRTSKKDRYLVPIPEEVKVVQMIFDWFTEDKKTTGWIAIELTKMGIPTVKKMPEWNRETVRGILKNVNYTGHIRWNQKKTVKELDIKTGQTVKVRRQAEEPQIFKGKHDAVISQEQFDKAQEQFPKQTPTSIKKQVQNPFAGLVRCCKCGKNMTLQSYNESDSRTPRIHHPKSMVCRTKSVQVPVLEKAVVEALKLYIADYEVKMEEGQEQTELIRHQEKIKVLEAELAKQEKRRRRLFDSWESEDGMYTKDEFLERKQLYTHTITTLKEQIEKAKAEAPAPVDYKERIVRIHQIIDCINNPALSAKDKNDFMKDFIDRIVYDAVDLGRGKGAKPVLEFHFR